jgi:hypothetical protein
MSFFFSLRILFLCFALGVHTCQEQDIRCDIHRVAVNSCTPELGYVEPSDEGQSSRPRPLAAGASMGD